MNESYLTLAPHFFECKSTAKRAFLQLFLGFFFSKKAKKAQVGIVS